MKQHTNALVDSSSPYLLQHARNPVNWQPWDDKLVKSGKTEGKLLLVSIGYAACHWCHVMEHESFEDEEVAAVMNENFVCIKVDREERPDVDHYYMTAVHLMGQHGGWPLNIIALPDGRPMWGGTYFPKKTWLTNIKAVANFWRENPEKSTQYAQSMQEGITQTSHPVIPENSPSLEKKIIQNSANSWKKRFDMENGGRQGQPKFPMPVNLDFLLYYGSAEADIHILNFVNLTLQKMARGGIYDQIGGGFARYSVDDTWKVPHFEKMLYDNAQLISIYSKGYQKFKEEEFKNVVYETARFCERELSDDAGAFYSSLDADSEGVEGKFYVWKQQELKEILKDDFSLFSLYYNVNAKGHWEDGNYILLRDLPDDSFASRNDLSAEQLQQKISAWKELLMEERSQRVRPGLDDKTIASWNGLLVQGLADAYKAFGDEYFRDLALRIGNFVKQHMAAPEGRIYHLWKGGIATVKGFLEDYALVIQAYLALYEISGSREWLKEARQLLDYTLAHFRDEASGLFYFSEINAEQAISNHFQNEDNVIPAANSVMANTLHRIGLLMGDSSLTTKSEQMLRYVMAHFTQYPQAFANWGILMLKQVYEYYEVAVIGKDAELKIREMLQHYLPNVLWAFSETESRIPLLRDRYVDGKTLVYVCRKGACQLPVEDSVRALKMIDGLN
jgi:uncharacterized protein